MRTRVRRHLIPYRGSLLTTADVSRAAGITQGQAWERIRKGLTGPDLLVPKRSPKECARMNPDPFGWNKRRQA